MRGKKIGIAAVLVAIVGIIAGLIFWKNTKDDEEYL